MGNFVKGSALVAEIEKLFDEANEKLIIVSPFIKLHSRLKDSLKPKINDPKLSIKLVYGKNESDKTRSLNKEDFEFFSQFANIQIFYEPRLHAKYYANDRVGILSSMNLYEYSLNNNIEFGVVTETKLIGGNSLDLDSWDYFHSVIDNSILEFHKVPVLENTMMGLSKKYVGSNILVNNLSKLFQKKSQRKNTTANKTKENKAAITDNNGFCIRTGESIPFNLEMPYSGKSFSSWNYFKNPDFEEKYCHYSGESSEGKTSINKPILSKHWNSAKTKFKF